MAKYKRGNKVRIVDNTSGHGFKRGDVVKINIVESYFNHMEGTKEDEYLATSSDGIRYWITNREVVIEPIKYKKMKVL